MFFEPSKWTYETGATGGIGIAIVAVSGGAIFLKSPKGNVERFVFGGLGAGWSAGFKIPKMPKVAIRGKNVAGAVSTKDFPSVGWVFRSAKLGNRDLTADDIRGAVVFVEGGLGLIGGAAVDGMLFGINPVMLLAGITNPALSMLTSRAIADAAGAVIFGGLNVGVQAGGGIAGLVGYMR
ncbi:hypothetical protein [Sphingomonas sp. PP-CE-1G-424]|uniref:hypothetical protein n=1 Tax=Sphingomonas sp. PP-CE-1G-424 TaxID=2135658 RepID=UPI0010541C99|nr:hypothetical protein [Sphingomonas sp. PP-CE-1G-424]TCP71724.1 hypothetical protein C8J43_102807 [Sphingomonas sp. PP-CE-1G-424]